MRYNYSRTIIPAVPGWQAMKPQFTDDSVPGVLLRVVDLVGEPVIAWIVAVDKDDTSQSIPFVQVDAVTVNGVDTNMILRRPNGSYVLPTGEGEFTDKRAAIEYLNNDLEGSDEARRRFAAGGPHDLGGSGGSGATHDPGGSGGGLAPK